MQFQEIKHKAKLEIQTKGQTNKVWHMSADVYGNLDWMKAITRNEEDVIMYKGIPITIVRGEENYIELKEKVA